MKTSQFPQATNPFTPARQTKTKLSRIHGRGMLVLLVLSVNLRADAGEVGWGEALVQRVASWFQSTVAMAPADSEAWGEIMSTLEAAKMRGEETLRQSLAKASQGPAGLYQHHVLLEVYAGRQQEINGLIERIKTGLITGAGNAPALLLQLNADLAEMERKEALFLENGCVKNPFLYGLAASAVSVAIEACISAAVESWQAMKLEQRRLLLEQLEAKKWGSAAVVLQAAGVSRH